MPIFDTAEGTLRALQDIGYFTDLPTATCVYLEANIKQAILLEGPAGAGKTELANSIAKAGGMRLIRLQCYQGIRDTQAIGHFNEPLQNLYTNLKRDSGSDTEWAEIQKVIVSRDFFMPGPLLEAIESSQRCVLLIDEVDKVDHEFEAFLLQLLSEWEISVPHLGTIKAQSVPFVVVISNAERELGFPLRRRCAYLTVEHPTPEREAAIVARRTPNCSPKTHEFIAGLAQALRGYNLKKPPSISEMNAIAQAMELLGFEELTGAHKAIMLPFIAKLEEDRQRLLMKQSFESIVNVARLYVERKAILESGVLSALEPFLTKDIPGLTQVADALLSKCWEVVPKFRTNSIIRNTCRLIPTIIANADENQTVLATLLKKIPESIARVESQRMELHSTDQGNVAQMLPPPADIPMLQPPMNTAAMRQGAGA